MKRPLALTAVAALATGLAAAPPAAQAAEDDTALTSLVVTVSDDSLVRSELVTLTVQARLTDPDGVTHRRGGVGGEAEDDCPCVVLRADGGVAPQAYNVRVVRLRLIEGTPQDGLWSGSAVLGAVNAGRWRATAVNAGDLQLPDLTGAGPQPVPVKRLLGVEPAVNVRGRDWPLATLVTPKPGSVRAGNAYTVRGTFRYSRSGAPAPGQRLTLRSCIGDLNETGTLLATVATRADGTWSRRMTKPVGYWCLFFGETNLTLQPASRIVATRVFARAAVTAKASRRAVDAGTNVAVSGRAIGASTVRLQRRTGRTWVTVGSTGTGGSNTAGSYTYLLRATPPRPGTWSYRVVGTGPGVVMTGTSPVVTITAR
ncbi:hypothetical protein [Motilibacter aurantiacus]|uniref:hypothetical protein n=1 Tax=Motilibacter aurantiacus TaxID=2714955 RepID=UPI00140C2D9A|nr:hypothetical protein [Motilibacter aurantiacus]NHC43843.1 hypothetical protein [Motilibacter aurantiacus]